MGDLSKEKTGEIVLHTFDELRNLALSFIPAGLLLEGFLGYHARLKQKRVIDFSERFKKALEESAGRELVASDFNNEDFVDVLESIFSKVQTTKSQHKLERFKNILVNQVLSPGENQKTLKFINLLDDITDLQIVILDSIRSIEVFEREIDFRRQLEFYNKPEGHKPYQTGEITEVKIGNDEIKVENKEINFFVDDLVSKGLINRIVKETHSISQRLFHEKSNSYNSGGTYPIITKSVTKYILSPIGRQFLEEITTDSD